MMTPLARKYQNVQCETASKERVMVLLFQTAFKHMKNAERSLEANDYKSAAPLLEKASAIVVELLCALNHEVAPELTGRLSDIYLFVTARITQCLATKDVAKIREAQRAFAPLVEAFTAAVGSLGQSSQGAVGQG